MTCTGGCGPSSKWSVASTTVETLVAQNPQINWGLAFYGSDNQCDVGIGAVVDVGPGNGPAIAAALATTTPGGDAPTSSAVTNAVSYLLGQHVALPEYILLVNDGRSGCGTSATDGTGRKAAEVAVAVARQQNYVPTFVLGMAPSGDTAAVADLNTMASNGGESLLVNGIAYDTPDAPPQLPILPTPVCLVSLIAQGVPQNGVTVSLDLASGSSVKVPEDPYNGWSFNTAGTEIAFSGTSCTQVTDGDVIAVTILYDCPPPPPGLD